MSNFKHALFKRFRYPILTITLLFHAFSQAKSQTCDLVSVTQTVYTDLTSANTDFTSAITLSGDASVTSAGISLTSTSPSSFGGFFFNTPTAFQGTGGFSIKVGFNTLPASRSSGAWEVIVAPAGFQTIAAPPFGPGEASNGLAGWSRRSALVFEFDSADSGTAEQDSSATHVAVFLDGAKRCSTDIDVPPSAQGAYTVWLDYDGFSTRVDVRISAAGDLTRPVSSTLSCVFDVWATLDMSVAHHVGLAAHNDGTNNGATHSLAAPLGVADAYRPFDSSDCSSFAKCAARTGDTPLCLLEDFDLDGNCLVIQCNEGLVWDVSGDSCCAFVEKGAWVASDQNNPPTTPGQTVACQVQRRIVGYLASSDRCP